MNIFFRELRAYRKSMIIWTVSLSLLAFIFLSLFPALTRDVDATRKILENLPPMMANVVGISLDSLFSISGFLSWLLTFVAVAGAVQAMSLGISVLSKEESGKTADFLLTKPVSRTKIITQKLLAIICIILITNITFFIISFGTSVAVTTGDFNLTTFTLISLKLPLIQIIFMSIGFLLSVIIPKIKSSVAISMPIVFSFFIIGTIGELLNLTAIRYVSPFKFFDSGYIISNSAYEPKFLIITTAFVVLSTALVYIIYQKKNIRAAA